MDCILDVCYWLLLDGWWIGIKWKLINLVIGDQNKMLELNVWLIGVVGFWKCFCSGDKGDVLSLVVYVYGLDFVGVMIFVKDFLGLWFMFVEEWCSNQIWVCQVVVKVDDVVCKKENWLWQDCEKWFLVVILFGGGFLVEIYVWDYWCGCGLDIDVIEILDWFSFWFLLQIEYWLFVEWCKDLNIGCFYKVWLGLSFLVIFCLMCGLMG